jgi:hypothetical protein
MCTHTQNLKKLKPSMVLHTCCLCTQEAEAGGWQVEGHPGLHLKNLYPRKTTKNYVVRINTLAISFGLENTMSKLLRCKGKLHQERHTI